MRAAGLCDGLGARGISVVPAHDRASAVAAVERDAPDVCLVDLDLPGGGEATIARVTARVPAVVVVALARVAKPEEMIAVLERGAFGYLVDGIGPDELAKALRSAAAGEPALARSLVPYLIAHVRDRPSLRVLLPAGVVSLTPRESEVAELVVRGLSTADIAARLGLSPVTVRRHVSSLLQKSGCSTRASLADALRTLTING